MMLKTLLCIVMMCVVATSVFAQKLSKEEEAVKKSAIQAVQALADRDLEKWSAVIVQDERQITWNAGPGSYAITRGWLQNSEDEKQRLKNYPDKTTPGKLTDWEFIISGDMAFVSCLQNGQPTIRVMLKQDGTWKELFWGLIRSRQYESRNMMTLMENFAGDWVMDASTQTVEPPWPQKIQNGTQTITCKKFTMTMNTDFDVLNPGGRIWVYSEQNVMTYNSRTETLQSIQSNATENSSTIFHGDGDLKDGIITLNLASVNDNPKQTMVQKISWKGDDVYNQEVILFNEDGEKEWVWSTDWVRQ